MHAPIADAAALMSDRLHTPAKAVIIPPDHPVSHIHAAAPMALHASRSLIQRVPQRDIVEHGIRQ
jgi:hypothetical protein